jgi:hypothetical protein
MGEKREEVAGNSETCSLWKGRDGRVAVDGMQRRPAAVSCGSGAPVHFRPWEEAEEVQLSEAKLVVVLVGSRVDGGDELGGDSADRCDLVAAAARRRKAQGTRAAQVRRSSGTR